MTKLKNTLELLRLIKLKGSFYSELELGLAFCAVGDFKNASKHLLTYANKNRSTKYLKESIKTNKARLLHDIAQFYFLQKKGLLDSGNEQLINAYLDVLESAPENSNESMLFDVPNNTSKEFLKNYNQLIYFDKSANKCKKAINPEIDWACVDLGFCKNLKEFVVLDNFLTKEALNELYMFCLLSTIWEQINTVNDFYATISNGLASPLIFQIAYELCSILPNSLSELCLMDGWAVKYCGKESEVGVHADRGNFTLNFWITPDNANLAQGTGGMSIWNKHFPNTFFDLCEEEKKAFVKEVLREPNIKSTTIDYKCNRAIIFRSSLAHGTEPYKFSSHYSAHRMNITLLFDSISKSIVL
jgi:hypothetical protein